MPSVIMLKKVKSGEMAERWSRGGTEGCGVTVRCEECPHLHTSISSKFFICLFQCGCLQYFLQVSTPAHFNIFRFFIVFFEKSAIPIQPIPPHIFYNKILNLRRLSTPTNFNVFCVDIFYSVHQNVLFAKGQPM